MPQEAYTTQELVPLLGIAPANIHRRAKREGWTALPRAKKLGGLLWLLASMPETTRARIAAALAAKPPAETPAVPAGDMVIPDWSYDMAKARFRIVMEWRLFRARAGGRGRNKTQASGAYLAALRAGKLLPAGVIEAAGALSIPTIYRWDKELRAHNNNLDALADRRGAWTRGGAKGCGQLGEEAESLLLGAWLTPNEPSMALAYEAMKDGLERRGLPVPSYNSARRFLRRFDAGHHDLVVLRREGEKALRDKVGPYIMRDAERFQVGDVLFSDGHTLNFDSLHPVTGKPCRLALISWFDWRSRMPVGWELMPTENTVAVASALHMAIGNLGKYPRSVYIDNGKAYRSKYFSQAADHHEHDGLFLRLGIDVQYSRPYQAQAKIIERFWGTFNEQCARLLPSYRGNSVDDKPAYLKRDEKYHKARHNGFVPTVRQTARIFAAYVNWYAHRPHDGLKGETPWSVFEPGRGPGVDVSALDRHFLLRKIVNPKRTGFVIDGIRYESDALYGLNEPVLACWKWADMSEVALFDLKSGARIGTAKPTEALHGLARLFGDELDKLKLDEAHKRKRALRRSTLQLAKEANLGGEALEYFEWMPRADERRRPLELVKGGKEEPKKAPAPVMSEEEVAELAALSERLAAERAAAPPYVKPAYPTDRELYEFLFDLKEARGVELLPDDAAFMSEYEQTPAYAGSARRYEDLRAVLARAKKIGEAM